MQDVPELGDGIGDGIGDEVVHLLRDRPGLTKAEIQQLSAPSPLRWGLELALFWTLMIGLLQAAVIVGLSLWLVPIVLLMSCLQNGMILWTHEGAHVNLVRDRRLNDRLADLLICGPIGVYIGSYRWHHGRHHRYLGDPAEEIELSAFYCIRGKQLLVHVARHLFGQVAVSIILRRSRNADRKFGPPPPRSREAWLGLVLVNAALLALCAAQGAFWVYPVVWGFPLVTLAPMISNFRTIVEHQPSSGVCESGMTQRVPAITRVVESSLLERLLIAPVGFHYHYEHHLYPGIPYHRLPEVRRLLAERKHYDAPGLVRGKGYLRTVWELASQRADMPRPAAEPST